MLGVKNPLKAEEIFKVSELAPGHPVYKLEGWGDGKSSKIDAIVLKGESGHSKSVQIAAAMMNIVDARSTQIALTPQELQEVKMWANGGDVPDVDAFRAAQAFGTALNQPNTTWLKMELKQLMTLDDAVFKRLQGDKADVRFIAHALKKHGGLEKLGEIISADLFNGSNDRFAYPPLTKAQDGKHAGVPLKVIQNVGNVFIACNGRGSGSPVGLDNFDPFSTARHVVGQEAMDMDLGVQSWGGNLLLKQHATIREQFVKGIIEDLEALLGGPRNRKNPFGSQNRLGTGRKQRLLTGMESGMKKMRNEFARLKRNANGRTFPVGINRKLAQLGW